MLRDALRGSNPAAGGDGFAEWLCELNGKPNSYCCGNVLDVPEAESVEEEVKNRRKVLRELVALLTESENMHGAERAEFVRSGMDAIDQAFGKA